MDDQQIDGARGGERAAETDEQAEARMMRALSMMSGGPEGHARSSRPGADRERPANGAPYSAGPGAGGAASALRPGGMSSPGPNGRPAAAGGGRRPSASAPAGQTRRHRFVQDGEVPVVSVARPRRDPVLLSGAARPADAPRRDEEDLLAERSLRAEAERRLAELAIQLRSFQTRLGDAELARDKAEAELRDLRLAAASLQTENAALAASLASRRDPDLAARRDPEAAARRDLDAASRRRLRGRPEDSDGDDPEPVKWWA